MRNHASGAALAAGVVALFIWAPIAGADDSPSCAPDAQHCQEQQKNPGEGVANQVIDNVQQGMYQAKQVQKRHRLEHQTGLCQ
jgi:hypothetical protein